MILEIHLQEHGKKQAAIKCTLKNEH